MNADSFPSEQKLRTQIMELSRACPFHQANPEDCPLFPLRKLEWNERRRWINALDEADVRFLARYHEVCLSLKTVSHRNDSGRESEKPVAGGKPGTPRKKPPRVQPGRPELPPSHD